MAQAHRCILHSLSFEVGMMVDWVCGSCEGWWLFFVCVCALAFIVRHTVHREREREREVMEWVMYIWVEVFDSNVDSVVSALLSEIVSCESCLIYVQGLVAFVFTTFHNYFLQHSFPVSKEEQADCRRLPTQVCTLPAAGGFTNPRSGACACFCVRGLLWFPYYLLAKETTIFY